MSITKTRPGSEASTSDAGRAFGLKVHPDRTYLSNEAHARPPVPMTAPCSVTHLAILSGEHAAEADRDHVARLCEMQGASPPGPGAKHFYGDLGPFRFKFERHTEFGTYTVLGPLSGDQLFRSPAIEAVPPAWLGEVAGDLLVGIHLVVLAADKTPTAETLRVVFGSDRYVGSIVGGGIAQVWTDFRLHQDGFSRMVVHDRGMNDYQVGRIVQWLLEIETYRMMALLALPVTRRLAPRVARAEDRLSELTSQFSTKNDVSVDETILAEITDISADAESIAAATAYRFAASRAYYALVQRRIEDLSEEPVEGLQTLRGFIDKRLAPAMNTVDAMARRLTSLTERISRALSLLRTRVDISLEAQNQNLLKSMDRRARQQLLLQQTVEGLSVVAISYYLIGILSFAAKGAKTAGLPLEPDVAVGIAIPFVVAIIWFGVRRIRRALAGEDAHLDLG